MIEDVPENVNAGRHQISYNIVDRKERSTDFELREFHPVKERLYEVPPCVLENISCSVQGRNQVKQKYGKTYNSQLKIGDSYFRTRGHSDLFLKKNLQKYNMIKENITTEVKIQENASDNGQEEGKEKEGTKEQTQEKSSK